MWIDADEYLEINGELIQAGEKISVENTPMDFRKNKKVGEIINNKYETSITGNASDYNWVLNRKSGCR